MVERDTVNIIISVRFTLRALTASISGSATQAELADREPGANITFKVSPLNKDRKELCPSRFTQ